MTTITEPSVPEVVSVTGFAEDIKSKSDRFVNYFLLAFFLTGAALAPVYDTWNVALGIGLPLLSAYYVSKRMLPDSNVYQYVLGVILGLYMAQFIYQMHGMFEMHFFAFIGSAILITYQNWKLQIPIAVVVVIHHALFAWLQFSGVQDVYFTQMDFMTVGTFAIHSVLALVIFYLSGLWSYHFHKYSKQHIEQNYELGKLQKNEEQNTLLRKTNLELDKFVYSVSHDLRAPLLSMQGVIEMTQMYTEEELTKTHMTMLKESVVKLDAFISDIHHYSRNARLDMKLQTIDFHDMLDGINQQLAYMVGSRPVDLNISIVGNGTFVSDRYRVQIILNNLISNAIRYQEPDRKPFVNINVRTCPNEAFITVEDNGIGIEEDDHRRIFDMFHRISDQSKGSGLGLYIVKETVDVLQGSIGLSSEPGIGSTFHLRIPNYVSQISPKTKAKPTTHASAT